MLGVRKSMLFVQLSSTNLVIAYKCKKNSIVTSYPLDQDVIVSTHVGNINMLLTMIRTFIINNAIAMPIRTVIAMPGLQHVHKEEKPFVILQLSLLAEKAQLHLTRIITQEIIDPLSQQIVPNWQKLPQCTIITPRTTTHIMSAALLYIGLPGILLTGIMHYTSQQTMQLATLRKAFDNTQTMPTPLPQIPDHIITAITQKPSIHNFLTLLATVIPDDLVLTALTIDHKKTCTAVITGTSSSHTAIQSFFNALNEHPLLHLATSSLTRTNDTNFQFTCNVVLS